jgi:transcription elongation factor Elf1
MHTTHTSQALADAEEEVALRRYERWLRTLDCLLVTVVTCRACGSPHRTRIHPGEERVPLVCSECGSRTVASVPA